jgi:hypothetical protein
MRSFWRVITWSPTRALAGSGVQTRLGDRSGRDLIPSCPAAEFGDGGDHDAGQAWRRGRLPALVDALQGFVAAPFNDPTAPLVGADGSPVAEGQLDPRLFLLRRRKAGPR